MTNPNTSNTEGVSQPVAETSAFVADLLRQAQALKNSKNKKGPATPEGKERSKYNALRHGFTGQVLIMTHEERVHFEVFVEAMMDDLDPVGCLETFLGRSMAEEAWRLNQIRARIYNLTAVDDFDGVADKYHPGAGQNPQVNDTVKESAIAREQEKELSRMSLYAQRTQRAFDKYKKQLEDKQAERKAKEAQDLEEARLLYQLADLQGLVWEPKDDGFVFSLKFIAKHTERHHKLILAKKSDVEYKKKYDLIEIALAAGQAA